jgi:ABC-type polysaccharide/polyol phosphate export permease
VEPEISLRRFRRPFTPIAWLRELWAARALVAALSVRELRARYKHAALGFLWALLVPLSFMVVFSLVFTRVAKVDTGHQPYAVFAYIGLLVWTFFSTSVSVASDSLLSNTQLLNRVYCPREVFPISSVVVAAVDGVIALSALAVLFLFTDARLHLAAGPLACLIPLLVLAVIWTTAVALVVSAAVVYLRDVRHLLPIVLQLGIIATPVAFGINVIPRAARGWYSAVNPLAPVIDGFRRVLLAGEYPRWNLVGPAAASSIVLLVAAYAIFKRLEVGFADIA